MDRILQTRAILAAVLAIAAGCCKAAEPEETLQRFVANYAEDPSAQQILFGVDVDGDWFTVDSSDDGVELRAGRPDEPTFFYSMSAETLGAIDSGLMNALTAAGKARSSDSAPLEVGLMDGYEPGPEFGRLFRTLTFHFWTRGLPEAIPFGESFARTVHGGEASVLFYDTGFRSSYYAIQPGQHTNKNPADQVNEFPSLLVVLVGPLYGRIDGREVSLESGHAYLIPAGQAHEFWNPPEAEHSAETLLLMFGEGA